MRILTYKRTHVGDPDDQGRFGINGCMGQVRDWGYDAVIGVGGIGAEPQGYAIAGRITWVGHGPRRQPHPHGVGEIITFNSFKLLDSEGPLLWEIAPYLARRIYEGRVRTLMDGYSPDEQADAERIVRLLLDGTLAKASRRALTSDLPTGVHTRCINKCDITFGPTRKTLAEVAPTTSSRCRS